MGMSFHLSFHRLHYTHLPICLCIHIYVCMHVSIRVTLAVNICTEVFMGESTDTQEKKTRQRRKGQQTSIQEAETKTEETRVCGYIHVYLSCVCVCTGWCAGDKRSNKDRTPTRTQLMFVLM